jgi:hypothetical protein
MSGRNAIFFSLDALVAVIAAAALLFALTYSIHAVMYTSPPIQGFQQQGQAALSSAAGNGVLIAGVSASTPLITHLDAVLPERLCGEMQMFEDDGTLIRTVYRTGCVAQDPDEVAAMYRGFQVNSTNYYTRLEVWFDD